MGAGQYRENIVPFRAEDGFECNLIHVRGEREPDKGPVVLIHGSGVRANIFRAPVQTNIVDCLVEHGYDVWLENWRASIDFKPNEWTLDEAAAYDHPAMVRAILKETGAKELKAIIHCQGSTSFMMSAIAGLVPEIKTIISNAVSLHPEVPLLSCIKAQFAVGPLSLLTPFLDPQWANRAQGLMPWLITQYVRLTHHECDNLVCKLSSFTYGTGHPTLWLHENLSEQTHEWLKQEMGAVPLSFFKQIKRSIQEGHLVAAKRIPGLPRDYLEKPPATDARFAFFAGEKNVCFTPSSQEKTYRYFDSLRPGYHSLHILKGYSHLDVFIGDNAARDVFPLILEELER